MNKNVLPQNEILKKASVIGFDKTVQIIDEFINKAIDNELDRYSNNNVQESPKVIPIRINKAN